jgi:hypothetical protein
MKPPGCWNSNDAFSPQLDASENMQKQKEDLVQGGEDGLLTIDGRQKRTIPEEGKEFLSNLSKSLLVIVWHNIPLEGNPFHSSSSSIVQMPIENFNFNITFLLRL